MAESTILSLPPKITFQLASYLLTHTHKKLVHEKLLGLYLKREEGAIQPQLTGRTMEVEISEIKEMEIRKEYQIPVNSVVWTLQLLLNLVLALCYGTLDLMFALAPCMLLNT